MENFIFLQCMNIKNSFSHGAKNVTIGIETFEVLKD